MRLLARNALAHCSFTARRGLIKGMRARGGVSFLPAWMPPRWEETRETRFLRSLELADLVVYDIGALHGHLTMFFAQKAGRVVAYETNPISADRIAENLRLNRIANVILRRVAVGDRNGEFELSIDPERPALSTGDVALGSGLQRRRVIKVPIVRMDDDLAAHDLPTPGLVKIDVEGMEIAVLRGMQETLRRARPKVYVEIHGADLSQKAGNARGVINLLADLGYDLWHVETAQTMTRANFEAAREGHLWAQPC